MSDAPIMGAVDGDEFVAAPGFRLVATTFSRRHIVPDGSAAPMCACIQGYGARTLANGTARALIDDMCGRCLARAGVKVTARDDGPAAVWLHDETVLMQAASAHGLDPIAATIAALTPDLEAGLNLLVLRVRADERTAYYERQRRERVRGTVEVLP